MRRYSAVICCLFLLSLIVLAGFAQATGRSITCAIHTGELGGYDVVAIIALFPAFASAFAAWKSYRITEQSQQFQKKLAKNQNYLNKMTSILTKMESLKSLLNNIHKISDGEFKFLEPLYIDIKSELQALATSKIMKENPSSFFIASSLGEALFKATNFRDEINLEICQIERDFNEIFT